MDQWFSQKASAGDSALKESTKILHEFISHNTSPATAAEAILHSVSKASEPSDAAFEFQTLLLDTVAEFSEPHDAIIKLLFAIRDIPPSPNPITRSFASMHREHLDALSGGRYPWKPEDKQAPTTPGDRWVNYNVFTAKLAQSGFDDKLFIFGFFCLRDALERNQQSRESELEKRVRPTSLKRSAVTAKELVSFDVLAAARWVLIAGTEIYKLGNAAFEEGWERGLAVRTDLWDGEPGLSRGRWLLWRGRFDDFADQTYVREDVRTLAKEASGAISKFSTE
ncbi:hypothetical protein CC86DRAFT_369131 [Ophiobolus disseminans]|uniref:Uncharacterized protein n=1 Tax=Ophiobolus disseminans TaxID=1469910 RepID=A0A6A7A3P5_9PLEO|nr:hypothetical protein CC86DRAFT_369131 [Ophiobolus disseminans]